MLREGSKHDGATTLSSDGAPIVRRRERIHKDSDFIVFTFTDGEMTDRTRMSDDRMFLTDTSRSVYVVGPKMTENFIKGVR